MRIDSHQHFWSYSPREYGWIDPGTMSVLARDFGPLHLAPRLADNRLDGCVAVQARQHEDENEYLLGLAGSSPLVQGVVGWVDLSASDVDRSLERWAARPRFCGVRHIAQAEPPGFLLQDPFVRGVTRLAAWDLTYDILIHAPQLPEATAFVDRCPDSVPFVLDHIAKPPIAAGGIEPWRSHICELARREHVFCKLSGMVTEASLTDWTPGQLRPYMDVVLEAFGADRVMYGSDWPVCLLAASYDRVYDLAASFISTLSASEQAGIMGLNASRFYRLASTS